MRAGLSLGINTDARTITNITLNEEYVRLSRHFGWNRQQFQACNIAALDAAFVDQSSKEQLASKLLGSEHS